MNKNKRGINRYWYLLGMILCYGGALYCAFVLFTYERDFEIQCFKENGWEHINTKNVTIAQEFYDSCINYSKSKAQADYIGISFNLNLTSSLKPDNT